jgi:ribosomal-protein-alanine N-acetyltransferase
MRQEDAIQMAEISLEAFPTMQPPTNYQREYRNPLAHYIVVHDLAANREVFGVKLTRYMVGYAGFWLMADEAHIVDIAVRETYRRQGLGELLLSTCWPLL